MENVDDTTQHNPSLRERISALDQMLERWNDFLELPKTASRTIDKYLSMTRNEIEAMTPELATAAAVDIKLYSYYLTKVINKNTARLKFCETELKRGIARESQNYSIWNWEDKRYVIIENNIYLSKLQDFIQECQARLDSVYGVTYILKELCESFKSVSYAKKSREFQGF